MANFLLSIVTDSIKKDVASDVMGGGDPAGQDALSKLFAQPVAPAPDPNGAPQAAGANGAMPQASKPKGKAGLTNFFGG